MANVVLVSMPFGPVFSPSIGLSLLKAGLARQGLDAKVHYFTIRFAEAVGQGFYCGVANDGRPAVEDLAGEWLFNRALFDTTAADDAAYVEQLLRDYYSDPLIDRLVRARALIDGFLDDCLESILRDEPRVVGFTSIFQQHVASLALARRLKRARPSTFIVFGGANCEGVMGAETVRSFPFVDAAVSGEGDLVFPELVRRVLSGERVSTAAGRPLPRVGGMRFRDRQLRQRGEGHRHGRPAISGLQRLLRAVQGEPLRSANGSRACSWKRRAAAGGASGCTARSAGSTARRWPTAASRRRAPLPR